MNSKKTEENHVGKIVRKAKESPFMVIGITGLITTCAIGAYKFRNRGQMSTSVFLMQLRVAAQGAVVACLTIGLAFNMAQEYLFNSNDKSKQE